MTRPTKKHLLRRLKEKLLFPSFAPPEKWRMGDFNEDRTAWRKLRQQVLMRDDYTCRYCGFRALKWQVVHHIDGNPRNNHLSNLETTCPMCNLILHAGMGCCVLGIVDLYKRSAYSQAEVVRKTRKLRALGYSDSGILKKLKLRDQVPFEMDKKYLRPLFAFVTSRKPLQQDRMAAGLDYGYMERKRS